MCASRMNTRLANIGGTSDSAERSAEASGRVGSHENISGALQSAGAARRRRSFGSSRASRHVENLAGGIMAWSDKVDPKLP